jgi:leader peptidase (prepilin peptidase) / N-methyltransferase
MRTDAVAVTFKVVVLSVVGAGVLDMLIMQRLHRRVPRFASHQYFDPQPQADRGLRWASAAPVRFFMGASTAEFMSTRTIWFPLVELLFGGAVLATVSVHGVSVELARNVLYLLFAIPLIMISGLSPGALTPNRLTYAGTVVGLATSLLLGIDGFLSCLLAAGGMLAFHLILAVISPRGMGLGSVKAAMMIGAFCGFPDVIVAALGSFLQGGIVGLYMILIRHIGRKDLLPFTPHQMMWGFIALTWGPSIVNKYAGMF